MPVRPKYFSSLAAVSQKQRFTFSSTICCYSAIPDSVKFYIPFIGDAMTIPHNYPLTYYRSPEFVDTFMRRAEEDYEAAMQSLQAIADYLREMVGAIRKAPPPPPLTEFIAEPPTVDHLIALIRAYAWHLLRRTS